MEPPTKQDLFRQLQHLDIQYAALARSQYSFGAGTASTPPTPEHLAEIHSKMAEIASKMETVRAEWRATREQ